LYIEAH